MCTVNDFGKVIAHSEVSATGEKVLIQGIGMDVISVPLHKINSKSDLVSGTVIVGVRPELPVKGVSILLGNDLADGKVLPEPIVTHEPCTETNYVENSVVFPACAVTRSITWKAMLDSEGGDLVPNLGLDSSQDSEHVHSGDSDIGPLSHSKLVEEQENDPEL